MAAHAQIPLKTPTLEKEKPIDVPWQALVPYPLAETPLPLGKSADQTTTTTNPTTTPTTTTAVDPQLLAPVLGHYADDAVTSFQKPTDIGQLDKGGLAPTTDKI